MSAGTYGTRITVSDRAGTISATGGITETTATVVVSNEPASIRPMPITMQGRETVEGGGMRSATTHIISLWYRTDIKPRMWVTTSDGRTFQIVSIVDRDEQHRQTQLLCYEWGT